MKVVPLAEVRSGLSAWVDQAQRERVLITRHGRPAALIIGVEGEELEDLLTRGNPRFWEMIEARRGDRGVSATEARRRLGAEPRPRRRRRPARRR
ncbi:MAG TPA: type II toxin-antitoxin system Phd/YefM family antitoxin [Polyangia bacterium]|jgi:prevent-host-death family protein